MNSMLVSFNLPFLSSCKSVKCEMWKRAIESINIASTNELNWILSIHVVMMLIFFCSTAVPLLFMSQSQSMRMANVFLYYFFPHFNPHPMDLICKFCVFLINTLERFRRDSMVMLSRSLLSICSFPNPWKFKYYKQDAATQRNLFPFFFSFSLIEWKWKEFHFPLNQQHNVFSNY